MTWTLGTDVSAFQSADPPYGTDKFGFVKITEGVGWESPVWQQQITNLRNLRDGAGGYHFANGGNSPVAEADYFWSKYGPFWHMGEPVAVDVEGQFFNVVGDPVGWTLEFAKRMLSNSGLITVFYSDWQHIKSAAYNWQPLVDFNMGLWGAAYNSVGFGDPSPWPSIFVWQDGDKNQSGGDDDELNGDLNTWIAYGTPVHHIPQEKQMFFATIVGDTSGRVYLTDGVWYRYVQDPTTLNALAAANGISAQAIQVPATALGSPADYVTAQQFKADFWVGTSATEVNARKAWHQEHLQFPIPRQGVDPSKYAGPNTSVWAVAANFDAAENGIIGTITSAISAIAPTLTDAQVQAMAAGIAAKLPPAPTEVQVASAVMKAFQNQVTAPLPTPPAA